MYVFFAINVVHSSLIIICKILVENGKNNCLTKINHGSGQEPDLICANMNIIKYIGCVIISLLYQLRSLLGSLIEMNIIFEMVSLITLIV